VDQTGVWVGADHILSKTVLWAAGVVASPAGQWLGVEMDRAGRVKVNEDLTVPGHPDIYVIGDTASVVIDDKPLPGVSPVAMQEGRFVAKILGKRIQRGHNDPGLKSKFVYKNKGNLATVGRKFAVADLGFVQLSGFVAWFAWILVHIYYLIGFRNRLLVIIQWAWAYLTFQRGARLIQDSLPEDEA
jgi:NADH dehydrogenase